MTHAEAVAEADRLIKALQDAVGPEYREMIASHGGTEGYLRWVRYGDDSQPLTVDIPAKMEKFPNSH